MGSHYDTLGVSKDASRDDIKTKFRQLSKETHPDVAGPSVANADKFKKISHAASVLTSVRERQLYDQELEEISRYGGNPIDRRAAGFGGANPGERAPRHQAAKGMQGFLDTIYRPRNLFVVGPLVLFTAATAANYFLKKEETAENTTKMVEAWRNPQTGHWEQPAPWDPAYREYRKINPKLELVPRDQVRTRGI
jgi:curved DNA-binding protein CbpA